MYEGILARIEGIRSCDPWWENETDWHRSWKGQFPIDWQEVVQFDEHGKKHIADVKTEYGWVLEFRHSFLDPEERRAREAFYPKLVWIVDGLRRKTDKPQLESAIGKAAVVKKQPPIFRVGFPEKCRLLKEWLESNAMVFLDFGMPKQSNTILWFINSSSSKRDAILMPITKSEFVLSHRDGRFDKALGDIKTPDHPRSNIQTRRASGPAYYKRYRDTRRRRF